MIYDAEVYVVKEAVKVVVRKSGSNLMDLLESKPDILSSFRIFSKYTLPIEVGGSSRRVAFTLGENFSGLHQIQTKKMAQKGPQTSFMFSSRYDTIYKGIHGPSPPPCDQCSGRFLDTIGRDPSCFQVQLVPCDIIRFFLYQFMKHIL